MYIDQHMIVYDVLLSNTEMNHTGSRRQEQTHRFYDLDLIITFMQI